MKNYKFELVSQENEEFDTPRIAESFNIQAYDLLDAVRKADRTLYNWGVTGHLNDFTDDDYNHNETRCMVSYGDADRGWSLYYSVEKI